MQSTAKRGDISRGGAPSRNSFFGAQGADPRGSVTARSKVASAGVLGTCATDAGNGFTGDTLQQEVPGAFT